MKILDGRRKFFQWDVNVKITSERFQEGDEVHFGKLVVKAYALDGRIVADVPNILLQKASPIRAYHYAQEGDSNWTVYAQSFDVRPRPKPDAYVYTETETFNFYDLKKEIEDIMGDVSAALDELHGYAQSLVGGESE